MWKIFLCGSTPEFISSDTWQNEFFIKYKDKFSFISLQPVKTEKKEFTSLEEFVFLSQTLKSLSRLTEVDLIIFNGSRFSVESIFQLLYSNLRNKIVFTFFENEINDSDLSYLSLMSDFTFNTKEDLINKLNEMTDLPSTKNTFVRDILFKGLQEEVENMYLLEDRKDELFRSAILTTQLGQLNHYLTHDRKINPGARSIGSKDDERAQFGDCIVQLFIYCLSRGYDIGDSYSIGIKRMEEAVWRSTRPKILSRELRPNEIGYGLSASIGNVTGKVVIINDMGDVPKISSGKCIVAIPYYQKLVWNEITARIENVIGLVSGTGTPNIHPAIICRELKKPCIVGAKELVTKLKDNDYVNMIVKSDIEDNSVIRIDKE